MSDGGEKRPQTKLYWSVSTKNEDVRIGKTFGIYFVLITNCFLY